MQQTVLRARFRRLAIMVAVAALSAVPLAACACLEDDWHAYVNWEADAGDGDLDCSFDGMEKRSKEGAALAENADPKLLAEARREAERECAERQHAGSRWRVSEK